MSATVTTSHGKATRAQEHRTSIVWHKAKLVVCTQLSECSDFDKTKKKIHWNNELSSYLFKITKL